MSSLFDFDAPPERYGVMGNPVAHSLSPLIHAEFARQTGQRIEYSAIQVDEGGLRQAIGNFQASGGKGLNITVPFKREAWTLVDARSPRAECAGAVNTLVFEPAGGIYGDNTDGAGLVGDLCVNLGVEISARRVLLIGAGGAVRGVLGPLLVEHPREILIANRTVEKAAELEQIFAQNTEVPVASCGLGDLAGRSFDLVINGTSASLGGETIQLPDSLLAPGCWCYDMMYSAEPTPFMRWSEARGAAGVADGLGMLVEQAAESFLLWRGIRPDGAAVLAWLRERLQTGQGPIR